MALRLLVLGASVSGAAALRAAALGAAGPGPEPPGHGQQPGAGVGGAAPRRPVREAPPPTQLPKQVAWLHIRKSGTSFVNALLRNKDLCPNWPEGLMLEGEDARGFFRQHSLADLCPEGFSQRYESPPGCAGIGGTFEENEGRVMGFFRQPEQRILSEYYHQHSGVVKEGRIDPSWLNRSAGCAVKSLTRQGAFQLPAWMRTDEYWPNEPCLSPPDPTEAEVKLAVERVRKMAFVGLTEEWSLSICLFHAMYGGTCRKAELYNTRPNKARKQGAGYPLGFFLGRWKDPYDGQVYAEARKVFTRRLAVYRVTRASCEKACSAE